MSQLRVIAVDDEPLALSRLEWCLQSLADVQLVGKASDARRGLELIHALAPDVVLLDIEMPELNGFELIEALGPQAAPEIIFVTAFDHFAVHAFCVSAVDYLLKPVERQRLAAALERARIRRELRGAHVRVAQLRAVIENLRVGQREPASKTYETALWVRESDARVRIPVEMIERLQADGDYVRLHIGQRVRLLRARLGDLAEQLDPAKFVRTHRSEIVRQDQIRALRRHQSGSTYAVLAGGREIPVSRRYLPHVAQALRLANGRHSSR